MIRDHILGIVILHCHTRILYKALLFLSIIVICAVIKKPGIIAQDDCPMASWGLVVECRIFHEIAGSKEFHSFAAGMQII